MGTAFHFTVLISLTTLLFGINMFVVNHQYTEPTGIINYDNFEKASRMPPASRETEKTTVHLRAIPTSPTLSTPNDLSYQFDSTGNVIRWSVSGAENGGTATLYQNGTKVGEPRDWKVVADLTYNIDGFNIGTYNFTMVIVDYFADEYYDTVFVRVVPANLASNDGNATLQQLSAFFLYFGILVFLVRTVLKHGIRKG